jgi:hypothetical protein
VRPVVERLEPAPPVVIELGEAHGQVDDVDLLTAPAMRGRSWTPIIVAIVAVLLLGGSAAPPASPLRELLTLPFQPTDTFAVTADSMLLVHSPERGDLTAYDLRSGKQRWQAPAPAAAYRLRSGGGLVLLRPRAAGPADPGTLAVAENTGEPRWRRAGTVVAVAGEPTVLAVSEARSIAGGGRRVEDSVVGVDAATGRTRWTVAVPSTAVLQPVPGVPARALFVHGDGRVELRDLETGALLAANRLPPADYAPDNPTVIGDTLLLRHPIRDAPMVTAYGVGDLTARWSLPADATYDSEVCGGNACLVGRTGVRAVDLASGAELWSRSGWRGVEQRGGQLLAYGLGADGDAVVGIVDPRTGRVVVDLRRWQVMPTAVPGGEVMVIRPTLVEQNDPDLLGPAVRTLVGASDVHAGRVRPLGLLPADTGECRAAPGRLVCRSGDRLVIWSYRVLG